MLKKRINEMKDQALKFGFSFSESGDGSILKEIKTFPLIGHSVNIDLSAEHNVMKKIEGSAEITVLDPSLRLTIHDNKFVEFTAVFFKLNKSSFPEFYLKPEQLLDKVANKFGFKDINFSEYPIFSKNYFLHGKDENAIRGIFTSSGIINFLEREKGFCVESNGKNLIIYKRAMGIPCIIPITELNEFINKGRQIFEMLSK